MKTGVVVGTFDLFHIGHLNLLERAAAKCDRLVAGVNRDRVVLRDKNKAPVIPEADRLRIVSQIKCVHDALFVDDNAVEFIGRLIGDGRAPDVYFRGNESEKETVLIENRQIAGMGVEVFMFPYTDSVSSTIIRDKLNEAGA